MADDLPSTIRQDITFLRNRDYRLVRELGNGACGRTVLLHDDVIDEYFVCKKYAPSDDNYREQLFQNFVREIKLLHKLQHENVVRVFNYWVYPKGLTGYILMEFVDGKDIESFVRYNTSEINNVFLQTIAGFAYLESRSILHRDIRPQNVMVGADGMVKIIDLGFGKHIKDSDDFGKSISLNWWCNTPADFNQSRYDFTTEVYFVGKLFEKLVSDNFILDFKYSDTLQRMCDHSPEHRIRSFADVATEIGNEQFSEIAFSESELNTYRAFGDALCHAITKIEVRTEYADDMNKIIRQLDDVYQSFMLEVNVPYVVPLIGCFVPGNFRYRLKAEVGVAVVRDFLKLLKSSSDEKKRVILANLHTRLNSIERIHPSPPPSDDIPF